MSEVSASELISVVIPVKNGSKYIREAIEGIKKQNMNFEIIVVDDASDDNTTDIAQSMGCHIIKHETTKGQVIGKNTGLKAAKGDFILFHDHDDVMNEGTLKQMLHSFDEDTYVVFAKLKDFLSPDATGISTVKPEPYIGLLSGAALIRKTFFDKIGFFDETIAAGDAIWLNSKLEEYNLKSKKLNIVSLNRRIHDTNYGRTNQKKGYKDYATVLRAKLWRT